MDVFTRGDPGRRGSSDTSSATEGATASTGCGSSRRVAARLSPRLRKSRVFRPGATCSTPSRLETTHSRWWRPAKERARRAGTTRRGSDLTARRFEPSSSHPSWSSPNPSRHSTQRRMPMNAIESCRSCSEPSRTSSLLRVSSSRDSRLHVSPKKMNCKIRVAHQGWTWRVSRLCTPHFARAAVLR